MLEPLDKETFLVHVGKAQRTFYGIAPVLAAKAFDSTEQGVKHLCILDEVQPTKTDYIDAPFGVGTMVDDGTDTANDCVSAQRQIALKVAELTGRILSREGPQVIDESRGCPVGLVAVEGFRKAEETANAASTADWLYGD